MRQLLIREYISLERSSCTVEKLPLFHRGRKETRKGGTEDWREGLSQTQYFYLL